MSENNDRLEAAFALVARCGPDCGSVWRHRKGGVCRVVCCAVNEADLVPVVVYREERPRGWHGNDAVTWVRPLAEFTDGRFAMVAPAPRES